ncbi:MAG: ribosome maturation factor RimM [Bdellovibrionota bacterium]
MDENKLANFVSVGKVRDSHGLKGELYVVTNLDKAPPWLEQFSEFTLEYKAPNEEGKHENQLKSFSVKRTRPHKTGFIVKSDEINDRNESDLYKGAVFYIKKSYIETKSGEEVYLKEVEGFKVYDKGTLVGIIVGFSSNTIQDLLIVKTQSREVEIPFVKAFVVKMDAANKKIEMDLPEGLLEITGTEENDEGDEEN